MLVSLVDRILKLLDENTDRSAVIMTCLDWSQAFDRQDPTIAVKKFLQLGVRPSLIPVSCQTEPYELNSMVRCQNCSD